MIRRLIRKIEKEINKNTLYLKNRGALGLNEKLKDIHRGKRCFIIGTGPSINNQDLTLLKDEQTIVVNAFWRHHQYTKIRPKYHIIADADILRNNTENFWTKEFVQFESQVRESGTSLLLNILMKDYLESNNYYSGIDKYYLAFNGSFNEKLKFNIELDKILPYGKNVMISGLIAAAYMGFEKIYLLGCEHDVLAYRYPRQSDHFYNERQYNLSSPEEVKKYALDDVVSYENLIHHVQVLFQNYRLLKKKLSITNPRLKIFNATPNSFLDVFPSADYETIINK